MQERDVRLGLLLFKGCRSILDHMVEKFTIANGSFVARSIEYLSLVINLVRHGPAGMITDSILDIEPHVGFFWGIFPILLLVSSLFSVAQSM